MFYALNLALFMQNGTLKLLISLFQFISVAPKLTSRTTDPFLFALSTLEKLIHQNVITFHSKSFSAAQLGFIPGRTLLQQLLIMDQIYEKGLPHTSI